MRMRPASSFGPPCLGRRPVTGRLAVPALPPSIYAGYGARCRACSGILGTGSSRCSNGAGTCLRPAVVVCPVQNVPSGAIGKRTLLTGTSTWVSSPVAVSAEYVSDRHAPACTPRRPAIVGGDRALLLLFKYRILGRSRVSASDDWLTLGLR